VCLSAELRRRLVVAAFGGAVLLAGPAVAHSQTPLRAVVIVRHGEKAESPKENPPLSPAGQARAQALLAALRDGGLTTIITTDQERTRATAAPLADLLKLKGIIVPRTPDPGKDAGDVAQAVRRAGGIVLVVSHQLTIPLLVAALGGPNIPTMCDTEFSNLYILLPENSQSLRLVRGQYGNPDPPHAPDCHITPVSPP
jgi:broad specificity phosphatase PhoE